MVSVVDIDPDSGNSKQVRKNQVKRKLNWLYISIFKLVHNIFDMNSKLMHIPSIPDLKQKPFHDSIKNPGAFQVRGMPRIRHDGKLRSSNISPHFDRKIGMRCSVSVPAYD